MRGGPDDKRTVDAVERSEGRHGWREPVFEQAARVFEGWTDPDTGVRVLRVNPPGVERTPGGFATPYQQSRPFRDDGRKMLLRQAWEGKRAKDHDSRSVLLDLTTGAIEDPSPTGYDDHSSCAVRHDRDAARGSLVSLVDLRSGRDVASVHADGFELGGLTLLSDGRRAVVSHYQGKPYDEHCRTHFHLLSPSEEPRVFLELDGVYGNHLMACPTDPDLFSYNAWPTPLRHIDGVTSIASVDGRLNDYAPLDAMAPRPGDFWGVRDHYVWTPDGGRIVSYLNVKPLDVLPSQPGFNHFTFDWWLSALDWRTGEDYCARYPPGRWGGHMQMSPDSRWIVNGGGPGFDKLYAVDLHALKDGWNEHVICSYPTTNAEGVMASFYPYPFVLPDGSGVIFNAGWPGSEHGVYLAEWPEQLPFGGVR